MQLLADIKSSMLQYIWFFGLICVTALRYWYWFKMKITFGCTSSTRSRAGNSCHQQNSDEWSKMVVANFTIKFLASYFVLVWAAVYRVINMNTGLMWIIGGLCWWGHTLVQFLRASYLLLNLPGFTHMMSWGRCQHPVKKHWRIKTFMLRQSWNYILVD